MENNLPKEGWYVRNDGSQLFRDTILRYLNNKEIRYGGDLNKYYGINKENSPIYCPKSLKINFGLNAKELTIQEFIELSKEKELSPEQLLEKANEKYNIGGLEFLTLSGGSGTYTPERRTISLPLRIVTWGVSDSNNYLIYKKDTNQWAEIISTPSKSSSLNIKDSSNLPRKSPSIICYNDITEEIHNISPFNEHIKYMEKLLHSLGIKINFPEHYGESEGLRVKQPEIKISKATPIKSNQLNSNINKIKWKIKQ